MDVLVAVSNTTPIISLAGIGQLRLLDAMFARSVVPVEVWTELTALPDAPEPTAVLALEKVAFVPAPPPPREAADLDPGERAAIAIALTIPQSIALIDEKAGREVALRLGVRVRGTLGVLVEAKRRGLVAEVRPLVGRLLANGCRLAPELVAAVLAAAGEH